MTFTPLSADELTWMRRDETASMTDTCTIQRKAGGVDSTGAPSKAGAAYQTIASNVPCRVLYYGLRIQGDEVLAALQEQHIEPWTLLVPYGTDLVTGDQVLVVNTGATPYLVLGTSQARTNDTRLSAFIKEAGV